MKNGTRPWAVILSVLLHVAVLVVLWWVARQQMEQAQKAEEPPMALELISGGVTPPELAPAQIAKAAPLPPVHVEVPQAPAEVNLGKHEQPKRVPKHVSKPKVVEPPKPVVKPAPKVVKKEAPKPPAKPVKEAPKVAKAQSKPVPVKKQAETQHKQPSIQQQTDDLLADLGSAGPKPGKSKVTQTGAKQGVEGGSSKGTGLVSGYETRIQAKIRPLVRIPDGLAGNPMVIVRVHVLASLDVGTVTVEKSSGNAAYDSAVVAAIKEAGSMPSLLPGMSIDDVRNMTLRFRPQS
jgi:colicin import membrane protein